MPSPSDASKRESLRAALADTTIWYAACEYQHPFWSGPDRDSYAKADADAKAHDQAVHGGDATAVVLNT
jgi:hypothetical protein